MADSLASRNYYPFVGGRHPQFLLGDTHVRYLQQPRRNPRSDMTGSALELLSLLWCREREMPPSSKAVAVLPFQRTCVSCPRMKIFPYQELGSLSLQHQEPPSSSVLITSFVKLFQALADISGIDCRAEVGIYYEYQCRVENISTPCRGTNTTISVERPVANADKSPQGQGTMLLGEGPWLGSARHPLERYILGMRMTIGPLI